MRTMRKTDGITQPNELHFTPDLKDQLKQHLNARLVYFQQSGLDITALFFNQSLPLLQLKLQSYTLLDLYLLQSRIEEVDKMLTEGLLTKYDKQRESLQHEQGRLTAISQQFRDCAVRYSRGCGVALNLASTPSTIATTSTVAANSTTASSLPEIPKPTMNSSAHAGVSVGSSQSHASERLYDPFDPDGSSDMSLCSPVRDKDQSHHRPHHQPPHHRQEPSHSQNANTRISLASSTESTITNNFSNHLSTIGQTVGLSGIAGSNAIGAMSQSADATLTISGGATSASEGPSRKKQKRMRDVVQGLIEENERIFTEFALLYLEQEKTYNTLLEHCKRVESDLANARVLLASNAMDNASKTPNLSTTARSVSLAPPITNAINSHNNNSNSGLLAEAAKPAPTIAVGSDFSAMSDANSNVSHLLSTLSMPVSLRDSNSPTVNNSTSSRLKSSLSRPFALPTVASMSTNVDSHSTIGFSSNAISSTIGVNKDPGAMDVEIAK